MPLKSGTGAADSDGTGMSDGRCSAPAIATEGIRGGATACAASSVAKVATGIGDGHEAVSSIAMVATGIRDGHEAVSTNTTEATGVRDEHKAAAAPPAFELNKMARRAFERRHEFFYFIWGK